MNAAGKKEMLEGVKQAEKEGRQSAGTQGLEAFPSLDVINCDLPRPNDGCALASWLRYIA